MITPECDQVAPLPRRIKILVLALSLAVLGVGAFAAIRFVQTRPSPPQKPPARIAPLVEVMTVHASRETAVIQTMGTVTPARQINIKAEVTGTIREVAARFLPGGTVPGGGVLVRLDPEDFRLAVAAKEAALASATADLELEFGQQEVARHEWALLNRTDPITNKKPLALRKPQLAQARAKVRQAETALDQARLDLRRTTVTAPFTALILEKNVDLGSRVSNTDTLATLVDAREYWVEATAPVDRLAWIALPTDDAPGARVLIRSQASGAEREGRVLHLRGDLEDQGRLARLLVSLPRPLETSPAPMLLGEYVRLAIDGRKLDNVIRLPRVALREGDTVWVVRDASLDIRPVNVAWRDTDTVLVTAGLASGDVVVTSELATPIQDMPLTLGEEK